MPPCRRHSITANADLDSMNMHGAIVAALHVVFTGPDQFDWNAAQALGNRRSLTLNVRIGSSTPAEPAACHRGVKRHLLWLEAKHFSNCHAIHCLKLRASPNLGAITIESNSGVQRLHRRVSQIWKFVLSQNPICGRNAIHRVGIATRNGDIAWSSGQLAIFGEQLRCIGTLDAGGVPLGSQAVRRCCSGPYSGCTASLRMSPADG